MRHCKFKWQSVAVYRHSSTNTVHDRPFLALMQRLHRQQQPSNDASSSWLKKYKTQFYSISRENERADDELWVMWFVVFGYE